MIKDERTIYYVQTLHDITPQKHLEQQKTEFLSIAAHEIKTPLTTIKLLSQSLLRQFMREGRSPHAFTLLDKEVTRLSNLINELLDISRIETGRLRMHIELFDLVELSTEIIKNIKLLAHNHRIVLNSSKTQLLIKGDVSRIEEVLTNLLTNALKYSPDNTTIAISLGTERKNAIVAVADEGIGIAKEKLPHIFERFYQIETHASNGFGLGLFIAKEIVKKHKGRIWVQSTYGKGSTFFVSLPLTKSSG